jgi:hypothetical protein
MEDRFAAYQLVQNTENRRVGSQSGFDCRAHYDIIDRGTAGAEPGTDRSVHAAQNPAPWDREVCPRGRLGYTEREEPACALVL